MVLDSSLEELSNVYYSTDDDDNTNLVLKFADSSGKSKATVTIKNYSDKTAVYIGAFDDDGKINLISQDKYSEDDYGMRAFVEDYVAPSELENLELNPTNADISLVQSADLMQNAEFIMQNELPKCAEKPLASAMGMKGAKKTCL